ncbi:Polysaccharide pyruvyl transferase [Saccharopolyspora kobensis]|uniref:Polysaccharide pyruvyl transferase n=1 Tax=Saccharopolyspora kobensis TaxID=146035 RepID=A0A1H6AFP2_9PSEU|nr:polysaccharide pyruvyl transferase family protein [Saccharopolyspora kobensis]SEG46887.1 Polysaccharide pyruvyl transferase [Saccharopolyspora kobensis]SFE55320.1 Polysaccharide pyruvyl transferase [Saccharopolyspora kobensis]
MRVLITGWPSFLHGEATAGDVLSMRHLAAELTARDIRNETAWSPRFVPGALGLDDARPADYTHLVFVCGPAHGWQVCDLHSRFPDCTRVAVGVSVLDEADPAVTGFHRVLPRDGVGEPAVDLSAPVDAREVPVAGVVLAPGQPEYGNSRRHEEVHAELRSWLNDLDAAVLELDTRLTGDDWRLCSTVDEFVALVDRIDVMVTTRLHGLVLALSRGKPVLAVDPVRGGGKMSAQAEAWQWPAVLQPGQFLGGDPRSLLDRWWAWCLRAAGKSAARQSSTTSSPLVAAGVDALLAERERV